MLEKHQKKTPRQVGRRFSRRDHGGRKKRPALIDEGEGSEMKKSSEQQKTEKEGACNKPIR